jgi:hypothetical protein
MSQALVEGRQSAKVHPDASSLCNITYEQGRLLVRLADR